MCKTSTHLIYGIVVKTWSLYIAALAHPQLVKPVLALDLIMMRFRTGTLQREEGRKILPFEIWEMIKVELYAIELVDAEKTELLLYDLYPDVKVRDGNESSTLYKPDCIGIGFELLDGLNGSLHVIWNEMRYSSREKYSKITGDFLATMSLSDTPAESSLNTPEDDGYANFNRLVCAVSVRFKPSSSTSSTASLEAEIDHETDRSATAALISPHIFTKSYRPLRFHHLVKYYRLDLADEDLPDIHYSRSDCGDKVNEGKEGEEMKGDKKVSRVEPKWMVWTGSDNCF